MKKHLPIVVVSIVALLTWAVFAYYLFCGRIDWKQRIVEPVGIPVVATSTQPTQNHKIVEVTLPAIGAKITTGVANVTFRSPQIFAYVHGTVFADGKIFLGMARNGENPFPTNEMIIFGSEYDISHPSILALPIVGDIETMIYDEQNDRVYFMMSNTGGIHIYSIDPKTYFISTIASSTIIDSGRKPAIVTDGKYIYGITDTDQSDVFSVSVYGGDIKVSSGGHISHGHSAAIGVYASSTELYFGGGMANGFEKVDATTLNTIASIKIQPCSMSDDMPYVRTGDASGYIYIGCEMVPYGIRVSTKDLKYERFVLPGASLGLFVYDTDLYNAAQDGNIDIFPKGDLTNLERYKVTDHFNAFDTKGQSLEPNEILYSPATHKIYMTAWLGVKGLYQVATSTDN